MDLSAIPNPRQYCRKSAVFRLSTNAVDRENKPIAESSVKVYLHTLLHFMLITAFVPGLVHCGKTSFDKAATPRGSAAIIPTASSSASSNDRDVEAEEPESTVASEPVSVGGAFLACLADADLSTSENAAVRCEFNSQGLNQTRSQDLIYGFASGATRAQATAIAPLRQEFIQDGNGQLWIWNFLFERTNLRDGWLYVDIQDRVRTMDPIIKVDLAIPAVAEPTVASTPTPTPTPAPLMLRFNSGPQKLGDDGAGRGVECPATDNVTIAMARSRTYAVSLSVETALNIVFSNLCGVGTGATNTTGSFTTATLRNANGQAVFQFTLSNQPKLSYESAKIPAGNYTLVVTPASRNGALNDFVYEDLMIEGAGITVK
jgi:hypothetical protein